MKKTLRKPSFVQPEKFHWFKFVFKGTQGTHFFNMGFNYQPIFTIQQIREIHKAAKLDYSHCELLNIINLGYTTAKQFWGNSEGLTFKVN